MFQSNAKSSVDALVNKKQAKLQSYKLTDEEQFDLNKRVKTSE